MTRRLLSALILGVASTACAPLQQAPLVYSSKIAVGVDITATQSEAPGFGFVVGYKQVDAAYVPVAVAIPCDPDKVGAKCDAKTYELMPLAGTATTEGQRDSGQTIEKLRKDLLASEQAKKSASEKQAVVDELNKQIGETQAQKTKMAQPIPASAAGASAAESTPPTPTPVDPAAVGQLQAKLDELTKKLVTANGELQAAEKTAKDLEPAAEAAQKVLDKLVQRDAHSVFGRFDGDIVGGGSEAKVSLGKVFSTGVASQNLTAGLRKYYEGLSASACFDSVAKLNLSDDKEKLKLLSACQAPVKP